MDNGYFVSIKTEIHMKFPADIENQTKRYFKQPSESFVRKQVHYNLIYSLSAFILLQERIELIR